MLVEGLAAAGDDTLQVGHPDLGAVEDCRRLLERIAAFGDYLAGMAIEHHVADKDDAHSTGRWRPDAILSRDRAWQEG